jgi:hypothetical protein
MFAYIEDVGVSQPWRSLAFFSFEMPCSSTRCFSEYSTAQIYQQFGEVVEGTYKYNEELLGAFAKQVYPCTRL